MQYTILDADADRGFKRNREASSDDENAKKHGRPQ
jgi:hypothetical protein